MAVKRRRSARHSKQPNETIKSSLSSQAFQPDSSDHDSGSSDDSDAPPLPKSKTSKLHDGLPYLKEAPSAYNLFLAEKSASFKIPMSEVVSMRQWSNMSAAEKEPYEKMAQPAKEAYKNTLKTLGIKNMRTAKKALNLPKAPQSASTLYALAKRAELAQTGVSMRYNDICALWPKLLPAEKNIYIEKAAILKSEYNKEYQKFLDGGGTPLKRRKRDKALPKRPLCAFQIFQQQHKGIGLSVAEMVSMWKSLPGEEEIKYHQMYTKNYEQYKREMEELGLSVKPPRGRYREHKPESDSASSVSLTLITAETLPIDINRAPQTSQSSESETSIRKSTSQDHLDIAMDETDDGYSQNDGAEDMDGKSSDTLARHSRRSKKRYSTAQATQERDPVSKGSSQRSVSKLSKGISQRSVSKRVAKIRLEPLVINSLTPKLMEGVRTEELEFDRLRQSNPFNETEMELPKGKIAFSGAAENASDAELRHNLRYETEAGAAVFLDEKITPSAMQDYSRDAVISPSKAAADHKTESSANGENETVLTERIVTLATIESESLLAIQRGIQFFSKGTPMARRPKPKSQKTIKLPGSISKSKQVEIGETTGPVAKRSSHSMQEAVTLLGRMRENINDARRRTLDGA
ncbi:hypothetical protein BJ741DRAFT_615250 [Chytriomyces cf. hyalinus JEL632]|nr:hypothetical protein BJ741DRAFT_615250 [Chytriomyces cf. hyalinus JEL632]